MGGIALAAALLAGDDVSVSVSPAVASGGGTSGGHVGTVTAFGSGGNGVYSYAWALLIADPDYALTINSPAAAATSFDFSPVAAGDTASAWVQVTVTSDGVTATKNVQVVFVNSGGGGGGGGDDPPFHNPYGGGPNEN